MARRAIILAATSAIFLTACGGAGDGGNNAVDANTSNEAALAANEAAPAPADNANTAVAAPNDGTLSAAFVVGRWTEENACDVDAMEFLADGTLRFPWGDTGRWTLTGDTLAMEGNPMTIRLEVISPTEMRANKSSGSTRTWTRCP